MNLNIAERQEEVNFLHAEIFGRPKEQKPKSKPGKTSTIDTDDVLLHKAFQSKNGDKIQRLYNGDTSDHPSPSEADQALCNHLAFWFGKDSSRIDAVFRASGLYRQKWDEKHFSDGRTYGQETINKAIAGCSQTREDFINQKRTKWKAKVEDAFISINQIDQAAFDGQMGCANLYIRLSKDKYLFDHAANRWYSWGSHYWKIEDIAQPLRDCDVLIEIFSGRKNELKNEKRVLIKEEHLSEKDPAVLEIDEKIKAINDQIPKLKNLYYRKQVIEFASVGGDSLGTSGDDWDNKPWLLPCKNGVVDLKTGTIRPGRQSDMLKTVCPTNFFGTAAKRPQFEKALLEIFNGDQELVLFIQRLFGMALIGEVVEHILPILFGAGRNGKDTFLEIVRSILGDMAGPVRAEMLLDSGPQKKNAGAPNAEIMGLRGKRLVWASETNEGRKLDSSTVKELTGGGHLSGRVPYGKREVSFKPSHTICMMTNSKPRANTDDYALWKRILLIEFGVSFVDDPKEPHEQKRDKDLPQKLEAEAEGILAWLVQGCLNYQTEGLNPPDVVLNATKAYQKAEDLLNEFFAECCLIQADTWVPSSALYTGYKKWADQNNLRPMTGNKFGRKIGKTFESKQKKTDGKNQKIYQGIGLIYEDFD